MGERGGIIHTAEAVVLVQQIMGLQFHKEVLALQEGTFNGEVHHQPIHAAIGREVGGVVVIVDGSVETERPRQLPCEATLDMVLPPLS